MAKTKVIAAAFAALLLFPGALCAQVSFEWEQVPMDGHRAGVTIPNVENVSEAIGTFQGKTYVAPNGKRYRRGSTPEVARLLLDAQPAMAFVKEYIGYCPEEMQRRGATGSIACMIVDRLMVETEKAVGKKVDLGLINNGGIRVDMPQGDVILDDILSMLPFKNYAAYVSMKGSDLKTFIEGIASKGLYMQPMGGVQLEIRDGKLVKCLVGGEPIRPDRIYGFATVDFLLAGGDGISVAKNAQEVIITDVLLRDTLLPYLRELTAQGKPIEYPYDGRIVVENTAVDR